ncbi:hypothetical protein MRB53_012126 [Persea americana]|uniref:Uncharacterized protein n=1 Tax=Persea americana TaxID=3435 RepID=A0ACC2LXU1_PERAE|nr:hypothetical protein MRB53_012126 [Persea americana]
MERWVPLFDIFLNSPSPQGEASLWFQQQQTKPHLYSPNAFLSLLLKPFPALDDSDKPNRCIWIQTLPITMQSRILSFLATERCRFPAQDLHSLSANLLKQEPDLDFWVKKAARQLFDALSPNCPNNAITPDNCSSMEKQQEKEDEEFDALPDWLHLHCTTADDPVLSWLPLSPEELRTDVIHDGGFINDGTIKSSIIEIDSDDGGGVCGDHVEEADSNSPTRIEIEPGFADTLDPEIQTQVDELKIQLKNFNSASETVSLAKEIHHLCFERGVSNAFAILGLIEPWEADDETVSILLSHLLEGSEDGFFWESSVLSSIVLPKMLVLQEPASRALVTATIQYCKLHQRAAVDGLLLPSVLVKEGINTPLCDMLTRIIRECLHPAHVSAFCQKLLCEKAAQIFVCLPCHQCLISTELVWTDALFTLFQNILNCNVYLTQDSVDHIVSRLDEMADRFSKSLKFGNFLLCLVSKCAPSLKVHRLLLTKAAERTNTFMTNSILSKLGAW